VLYREILVTTSIITPSSSGPSEATSSWQRLAIGSVAVILVLLLGAWLFLLSRQPRMLKSHNFELVTLGTTERQAEELLGGPPGDGYGYYRGGWVSGRAGVKLPDLPGTVKNWQDHRNDLYVWFDRQGRATGKAWIPAFRRGPLRPQSWWERMLTTGQLFPPEPPQPPPGAALETASGPG
jgi:hypothetical protein